LILPPSPRYSSSGTQTCIKHACWILLLMVQKSQTTHRLHAQQLLNSEINHQQNLNWWTPDFWTINSISQGKCHKSKELVLRFLWSWVIPAQGLTFFVAGSLCGLSKQHVTSTWPGGTFSLFHFITLLKTNISSGKKIFPFNMVPFEVTC